MPSPSRAQDPLQVLDASWARRPTTLVASDAAHAVVREAILMGHLPPGVRLSEEALARRFSVSRTPVREALLRLEAERLLERAPRGGLVVGEVRADEILEVYAVRVALDGLIARLAADNATSADLERMRGCLEDMARAAATGDMAAMADANLGFHEEMCRATRNGLLQVLLRQVHDRVRRFPGTTFAVPGRAGPAVAEHGALLRAIEARDPAGAAALAEEQMRTAMRLRIEMLRSGGGRADLLAGPVPGSGTR